MSVATNSPIWADHPGLEFAPLPGDLTVDACVIGLGGSGLAAVHEFQNQGLDVVGVDAGSIAQGAAGRNGGFLLAGGAEFHHDAVKRWGRERAIQIYRQTLAQIEMMANEIDSTVRRVGSFRRSMSEEEMLDCHEQYECMRNDGLPAEWRNRATGTGIFIPTDAAFQPLLRCQQLAARAIKRGARLFEKTSMTAVETGAVVTAQGTVRAKTVIVAVDGNLEKILPQLSGRVRTARLQMLATEPTNEVDIAGPVYARYGFEYWHQLPDRRVALGGLRDRFGEAEWTGDAQPSEELQRELERVLREDVGVKKAAVTHRWAGAVGFTPDYLPIISEVEKGVWAIGGYCGTGNVVGAICGRGVVHLALHGDKTELGGFLS